MGAPLLIALQAERLYRPRTLKSLVENGRQRSRLLLRKTRRIPHTGAKAHNRDECNRIHNEQKDCQQPVRHQHVDDGRKNGQRRFRKAGRNAQRCVANEDHVVGELRDILARSLRLQARKVTVDQAREQRLLKLDDCILHPAIVGLGLPVQRRRPQQHQRHDDHRRDGEDARIAILQPVGRVRRDLRIASRADRGDRGEYSAEQEPLPLRQQIIAGESGK